MSDKDYLYNNSNSKYNKLFNIYDKVMRLKIFVDSEDEKLKNMYRDAAEKHNNNLLKNSTHIDAGFDLFAPGNASDEKIYTSDSIAFFGPNWKYRDQVNKLDFKVCCSAAMYLDSGKHYNTGYYMYPRSSLSKTQLRLANSVGIIDAGYRGHLMGMFDVVNISEYDSDNVECDYFGEKYDRYLQICAPALVPIIVEIVDTKDKLGEETERGEGGFGSTGR
jgi:dUTPase